jgi:hypothetical protein
MSDDTKKETVADVGTVAGADEAASTRRSSREITFAEFLEAQHKDIPCERDGHHSRDSEP